MNPQDPTQRMREIVGKLAFGDDWQNKSVDDYTPTRDALAELSKLIQEQLRIIHKTMVDNNVAGPAKWQVEDMQAALQQPNPQEEQ